MIGIIGYKNQSTKIINILIKLKIKNILVYCIRKNKMAKLQSIAQKKILYTNNIDDLLKSKYIFISSPNDTHFKYIKKFMTNDRYIFCEKAPCINSKELDYLKKLPLKYKSHIYFNFNYLNSSVFDVIKKEFDNELNGQLINISVYASHGLFFKNSFKNNWRIRSKNIFDNIVGNLGIHYINLIINLTKIKKISRISRYSFSKKGLDTGIIFLDLSNSASAQIFLSYASVASQEIKIYFTNAILEYDNNSIYKYSPRNTFDKDGYFKKPSKKIIIPKADLSKKSLENSIKFFLRTSDNKLKFDTKNYEAALKTVQLFLDKKN